MRRRPTILATERSCTDAIGVVATARNSRFCLPLVHQCETRTAAIPERTATNSAVPIVAVYPTSTHPRGEVLALEALRTPCYGIRLSGGIPMAGKGVHEFTDGNFDAEV